MEITLLGTFFLDCYSFVTGFQTQLQLKRKDSLLHHLFAQHLKEEEGFSQYLQIQLSSEDLSHLSTTTWWSAGYDFERKCTKVPPVVRDNCSTPS